jgi:dienelactone hydrolase
MRRTLVVLLTAATLLIPVPQAVAEGNQVYLPEPTGPFQPGTTRVHLVDENRTEELAPGGGPRELMAQLWYPALPVGPARPAPYAPPKEAVALRHLYPGPPDAFEGAVTNSLLDAPALPGHFPVVVFAHGLCGARTDTTVVNEQLASLGFVVVALGVTHESNQVEFPDGRLVGTADPKYCGAGSPPDDPENAAILLKLQRTRVGDVRFTLDELTDLAAGHSDLEVPWGLDRALNLKRIGMFGHSLGGSTAAQALAEDPRISAGINMDGLVTGSVRHTGLAKPFLLLGSDYHHTSLPDPSWADFLPKLSGWHRWLRVVDAGHYRFIDIGGSATRWQLKPSMPPEAWELVFDDIDDERSQRILVAYTTAFFQRFLRGLPQPLLDRPSTQYPEVEFRDTGAQ